MTVESLKPFLSSSPTSGLVSLPPECSKKKPMRNFLLICGSAILLVLTVAVFGLEIWNINRIADLQREVDGLRQQMHEIQQLRLESIEDFNDFEQAYDTNDIPRNSDEYEEEEEMDTDIEEEEGSTVFGAPDYNADDIETEISVTATANSMLSGQVDGKRRARSITGITYQGVPIMEESYMSRNRTRHHLLQQQQQQQDELHHHARQHFFHHPRSSQFQQMRQRPEEVASPPPQLKLKWDDEGREIPSHHQQLNNNNNESDGFSRHSSRRHHQNVHHRTTTSAPGSSDQVSPSPAIPSYVRRNEFSRSGKLMETTRPNQVGPDYTTKPPGPTHDRRSRVMLTNAGENKYQKVIKNPGTYMESRQPPVQRVGRLVRKSAAPARVTALHLAKYHHHYTNMKATDHATWHWHPVDVANLEALKSGVFKLTQNGSLIINDSGLFFVYAQITYNDHNPTSGFNILLNGKKHVSCSIHGPHGKKTNACYTAALIDLENGSQLEIRDMDEGRVHLPYQEKTFFGLYKLGRRPVAPNNT